MKNEIDHTQETISSGKNLIILREVQGNEPARLTSSQEALLSHVPLLYTGWWVIWLSVLGIIFSRYLLLPLIQKLGRGEVQ